MLGEWRKGTKNKNYILCIHMGLEVSTDTARRKNKLSGEVTTYQWSTQEILATIQPTYTFPCFPYSLWMVTLQLFTAPGF